MRITIDVFKNNPSLTRNEFLFLDKSFQLLSAKYPEHEWIHVQPSQTKGLKSLLPLGIKKILHPQKLQTDLLITLPHNLQSKSGSNSNIFFYSQFDAKNKKEFSLPAGKNWIVTTSAYIKKELMHSKQVAEEKIFVIPAAPLEEIVPIDLSEKLQLKEKQTGGKDFFVCFLHIGRSANWEEILRAFSAFKKWQQTAVQLLIVAEIEEDYKKLFFEKIASYKFREDVRLVEPADLNWLIAAAYAVLIPNTDATGMNILNSFKAEVPVITSGQQLFSDAVSGAFMPAEPSAEELSRQLINLYRDERLREFLVKRGKIELQNFSWDISIARWRECLAHLWQDEFN